MKALWKSEKINYLHTLCIIKKNENKILKKGMNMRLFLK